MAKSWRSANGVNIASGQPINGQLMPAIAESYLSSVASLAAA